MCGRGVTVEEEEGRRGGWRGRGGSFDIVVDLDDNGDDHYRDEAAAAADDDDGAFYDQSPHRDDDCFGVNFGLLGGE